MFPFERFMGVLKKYMFIIVLGQKEASLRDI
jgi:hypothetical protein